MTLPTTEAVVGGGSRSEPVIELDGVVKEYAGTPPVRALDGVDLRIDRGELVAIVGPSGSGKSTLLHLLGALDRSTSGTVRVAGRDVDRLDDRAVSALRAEAVGFVFQQFHLLDALTARDNVATGLLYRGIPSAERRRRAETVLEAIGLRARMDHRPSQLSGGERQRVAIARAVVGRPALVLADEPTGNLDSKTGAEVLAVLRALHLGGSTVVVITHDRTIAEGLPRRIEVRDGRIEHDTGTHRAPA